MAPRPVFPGIRLAGPYHDAKGWKVSVTDNGRTATRHYIGAAEKTPVLRLVADNNCDTKCDTTSAEQKAL